MMTMKSLHNCIFGHALRILSTACATLLLTVSHADVGDGPALWQVSDADNSVYLFGTFHLLPEGAHWATDTVKRAMDDAPITVTEADVASPEAQSRMQQLVMQHGVNPAGTTLTDVLGEQRASKLFDIAARFNVPETALQPLRPWLALLSITQAAYVAEGFNPALGVEQGVLAAAAADGDTVAHLETLERQIMALASLEEGNLDEFFDMSLEDFDDLSEQLSAGLKAWLQGDVDGLDAAMIASARESSPAAFEALFASRNREWLLRIEAYLDGDVDTFIAVGAGHLVGDDSVIDMLSDRGIEVRRLQ